MCVGKSTFLDIFPHWSRPIKCPSLYDSIVNIHPSLVRPSNPQTSVHHSTYSPSVISVPERKTISPCLPVDTASIDQAPLGQFSKVAILPMISNGTSGRACASLTTARGTWGGCGSGIIFSPGTSTSLESVVDQLSNMLSSEGTDVRLLNNTQIKTTTSANKTKGSAGEFVFLCDIRWHRGIKLPALYWNT